MKKLGLVIAVAAMGTISAWATVIANYDFTAITDPNDNTETFLSSSIDTEANSAAADITSPATHNGGAVNPEFGEKYDNSGDQAVGWSKRANNPLQTYQIVNPIDTYFTFSVSAGSGYQIDLGAGALTLLTGTYSGLSNTTACDFMLYYSTDGVAFTLAETIGSGTSPGDAATVTGNGTVTAGISFDLSGLATTVATDFYFRLDPVATAGSAQNGTITQRAGFIDDVVLDGTVSVIPEPGTLGLVASFGACILFVRRKLMV